MRFKKLSLLLLAVGSFLFSIAQLNRPVFNEEMKKQMCERVREAARHAWKGYTDYAWGHDDLKPLTKSYRDWYQTPLLMTPVDAFDTFILLGLTDEATAAKKLVLDKLNFNIDANVQVFEITIRLLAGLQSAYELDGDPRFLQLAQDLANRLMPAFHSKTGMPYRYVHLQTGATADSINNPAEIGTLMLEFGKLSKLTGDPQYYNAAKKAILYVYEQRSAIDLVGEQIDINTGQWVSTKSHISGYIDSYYEYLYKSWLLFGDRDFKTAFDKHQVAIKKYLIDRKSANGWFMRQVNMHTGKQIATIYGALDAFYAGLCAFSGDINTAKKIQQANYYMWTKFNIEPEAFNYKTDSIVSPYYILRPENLESCFYLYRLTQDRKYLIEGKRMVDDILLHCRNEVGFASLNNVKSLEKSNSMESFFFAETLKYAYLIFAPVATLDLKQTVLTTEAHPFKIKK